MKRYLWIEPTLHEDVKVTTSDRLPSWEIDHFIGTVVDTSIGKFAKTNLRNNELGPWLALPGDDQ